MEGVYEYEGTNGGKIIEVRKDVVVHKGRKWTDMSNTERRKFDNFLYLKSTTIDRVPTKIIYL